MAPPHPLPPPGSQTGLGPKPWPKARHAPRLGGLALGTLLLFGCGSPLTQITTADATRSTADSYEAQLAQYLTDTGSVMYGAYWCPHCADQKALFQAAADQIPYIECAADGDNAQPELCKQKGIQGYPTWEINGQFHLGVYTLDQLASMAGFSAP